jgi:RND family efflux transporter MFP subunit
MRNNLGQGNNRLRRLIAGNCLIAMALASSMASSATPSGTPIVVALSELSDIVEEVPVSGTVRSPRVARLSAEVAGLIQKVMVDSGDRVKAGVQLVELDRTLAELALEAARAMTEQAREELADAQRRLNDAERLVKSRGIAETEIQSLRSEVRADGAMLRLRLAEQDREQERLRRHTLKAPFTGVISNKLVEAGEWIAPGDEVVELIADTGLRVDFRVPQAYYPRVDASTQIDLRIEALPDRPILASVGEVIPVSDPTARTFVVRVYLKGEDLPLTPGMSATGTLRLATSKQQVVVSRDALLRHPDGRVTVWVVDGSGEQIRVEERRVTTGLSFDSRVVITEGIAVGTPVVVEGNEALRQGQRVTIRAERR